MVDEDTRAKIIEGFLTDETTPSEQAQKLHIGRKTYEKVVVEEVELRTFHNREQAWDLYKDVSESTVLFYRLAGLSRLGGQAEIINTVLSNEQIEEKVSQGVPMAEILSEINMPTININILYRYTEKLGIAYKKEDIVKNRVTAITNKWKSDIEWGNKVKQTLARVNAERNARRPKKPPKIKFKKPNGDSYWNGNTMFDLEYCNWNKDIFMGVLPDTQFGDVASIDTGGLKAQDLSVEAKISSSSKSLVYLGGKTVYRDWET